MNKLNYYISEVEIEELKKTGKYTKKNIKKIINNYPSQYIIGYVNFYGYKILVNKNVLIPRYETETLVYKTLKYMKEKKIRNPKILDLCTGSGCIAITLKKEVINADVTATDISSKAISLAKKNAKINNIEIKYIKSNLFKKIKKEKYDVIITNPPYIPTREKLLKIVKYEPRKALYSGKDGTKLLLQILKDYKQYLKPKGILAIEIHETHKKILKQVLEENKLNYTFEKDLAGKNRYLFIFNE